MNNPLQVKSTQYFQAPSELYFDMLNTWNLSPDSRLTEYFILHWDALYLYRQLKEHSMLIIHKDIEYNPIFHNFSPYNILRTNTENLDFQVRLSFRGTEFNKIVLIGI
jgi:hypothetical protein